MCPSPASSRDGWTSKPDYLRGLSLCLEVDQGLIQEDWGWAMGLESALLLYCFPLTRLKATEAGGSAGHRCHCDMPSGRHLCFCCQHSVPHRQLCSNSTHPSTSGEQVSPLLTQILTSHLLWVPRAWSWSTLLSSWDTKVSILFFPLGIVLSPHRSDG